MPDVPGLPADVYFGPTNRLPEWSGDVDDERDEAAEDRPLTPGERKSLVAVLGFDPAELDGDSRPLGAESPEPGRSPQPSNLATPPPAAPVAEPDAPPPPAKRPGGLRRAFRRLAAAIKGRPAPQVTVTPQITVQVPDRPRYKMLHVRDAAGNLVESRQVRVDGGSDDAATPAAGE